MATTVRPQGPPASSEDARDLERALRKAVSGEVRFDAGSRALYATDGSNYRQVPIGVVVPRSVDDVVATVELCRDHDAPVLSRGGGTSLAGQCCNVAVVIDWSKHMRRILSVEPEAQRARVQPGVVLDRLRDAAERHHLTFAPDPSTHAYCTLGGMIGNNSCGVHSVMGGLTVDNVEELEVLTYDGLRMRVGPTDDATLQRYLREGGRRAEIYGGLMRIRDACGDLVRERYPKIPRRVSGFNLDQLLPENGFNVARALVGTEGTCVTVLEAYLRLVPSPPCRTLVVLGYSDVYEAADRVMEVLEFGPIGLEGIDKKLTEDMTKKHLHEEDLDLLPEGEGWLLAEFGGDSTREADARAQRMMDALRKRPKPPSMKLFDDAKEEKMVWEIRESGLGATARIPGEPDTWEGWEDSAVPPERMGDYLRDLRKVFDRYGYDGAFYGHFGQGCLHTRINFDLVTSDGIKRWREFLDDAADLVVGYGGSLSGEHGDGQSRAEMLPKMFGPELVRAFGEFKAVWDPQGKMNPGKVVEPYRITENLRLGVDYRPWEPRTKFAYTDDDRRFSRAALRCVGVGKCRRTDSGIMCPSYQVTLEEEHSTRGRAHLLFELLQGDPLESTWRSDAVHDALDLCLACKGCKGECPVNVDMATYKAEFLSHYYKGRVRPRAAYAIGLIYWWSRLASRMPKVANLFARKRFTSRLLKRFGGIHPERDIPPFAEQTFVDWFRTRQPSRSRPLGGQTVMVWPDTFTNYLHPSAGRATVEVLEAAGFRVTVPSVRLCCGRPLYDYGMLDLAKRLLRQILDALRTQIRSGVPLVGVEPSCVAVFRDELLQMFPDDPDAKRLSEQTFVLSEFLEKQGWEPPKLARKAVVQAHCHHKSVMKITPEQKVMEKMGLDFEVLDSGCCGMAGSFGFEEQHYDVSMKVGERVLLPRVRQEPDDTLVIADGFSCRTQIEQATGRKALHLAEVLAMALSEGV